MKKLVLICLLNLFSCIVSAETYYLEALHEVIYHEARGEPEEGMVAVGQVVINRVRSRRHWPDTISEVRSQPKQFSYYKKPFNLKMDEEEAKRKTFIIAVATLANIYYNDSTKNSVLYHACDGEHKVKPRWDWSKLKFDAKIGNHCFYSLKPVKKEFDICHNETTMHIMPVVKQELKC